MAPPFVGIVRLASNVSLATAVSLAVDDGGAPLLPVILNTPIPHPPETDPLHVTEMVPLVPVGIAALTIPAPIAEKPDVLVADTCVVADVPAIELELIVRAGVKFSLPVATATTRSAAAVPIDWPAKLYVVALDELDVFAVLEIATATGYAFPASSRTASVFNPDGFSSCTGRSSCGSV